MYTKFFLVTLISTVLADSSSRILADNSYTPLPISNSIQSQEPALDTNEAAPYAPYAGYNNENNDGYTIQSGYEGYLVPYEDIEPALHLLETKGFTAAGVKFLQSFPKLALKIFIKAIPNVLAIGAIILIGGALTTVVCSFTSICSHSYLAAFHHLPFKFDKEQVRSFVSEDKINAASIYVKQAIDNFYKTHGLKKASRSKKVK